MSLSARLVHGCPFFYGYVVAVIGTLGMVATGPGQTPVIGTTISAIENDLDITSTKISGLYLGATLMSALILPWAGRLLDMVGPPLLFACAVAGLGVSSLLFSYVEGSIGLMLCFFLLRFCGQGTLFLVSTNAINLWWEKRRGRIMGICSFVNSICLTGLFSSTTKELNMTHGWRWTYTYLGFSELCIVLPLGAIFLRSKPEVYGLHPDGGIEEAGMNELPSHDTKVDVGPEGRTMQGESIFEVSADVVGHGDKEAEGELDCLNERQPAQDGKIEQVNVCRDFTFSEAIRTGAFWALVSGVFCIAALGTALFFHVDSIFDNEVLTKHVKRMYLTSAVVAGCFTIVAGFLIDFLRSQRVLALALFCESLMLLSAMACRTRGPFMLFVVGFVNGAASGLFGVCNSVAFAKMFGRTHNGKIQGLTSSFVVFGSAVGPEIFAIGHNLLGDYSLVLLGCSIWPAILCVCVGLVPNPSPKHADLSEDIS